MTSRQSPRGQLYVGASTKAYFGYTQSLNWLNSIRTLVDSTPRQDSQQLLDSNPLADSIRAFVIPSFPVIESAIRIFEGTDVWVGSQTSAWGDGPLTGEVSPTLLAELGVRIVEVGHVERRRDFGETDEVVARKTAAALSAGLTPLVCVGEPQPVDPATAAGFVYKQVHSAIGERLADAIVAYEPSWAIGADAPADTDYVNDVISRIRILAADDALRVIYGGSAAPGLLSELVEADGVFLGRFAHDAANFGLVLEEAVALVSSRAS